MNDNRFNPPEDCSCGEFHTFRDGLCWRCWTERREVRGEEKREQRELERREENRND